MLLQHPNTALLMFTQSLQQGSRRSVIRIEKEYALANPPVRNVHRMHCHIYSLLALE